MTRQPYLNLVRYKRWAGRGLLDVVAGAIGRMSREDTDILLRIFDHIIAVDLIFQCHLEGRPGPFKGPRFDERPALDDMMLMSREVDDWYVAYVEQAPAEAFEERLDFRFTSGKAARMSRGEIITHVCLHGTLHRGNAGLLLQKNGIDPNDDRITDFLEMAA